MHQEQHVKLAQYTVICYLLRGDPQAKNGRWLLTSSSVSSSVGHSLYQESIRIL